MHETETKDPGYSSLLDRIEELQHELARLRAEAAANMPAGDALRRASAFDAERTGRAADPHRNCAACRPRATIDTPMALAPVVDITDDPVLDLAERAFSLAEQAARPTPATGPATAPATRPATDPTAERSLSEIPMDIARRDHVTAFRAVSADGRGAVLAGGTAPVRLLPNDAPTHPTTGRSGDLFVDAEHRLWFCRAPRDWAQIA